MSVAGASGIAFVSGFSVMVLEIVGMRLLARDFGSSFYVWTSQIGVVLVALTLGYMAGGLLADCRGSVRWLAALVAAAGLFTVAIPQMAPPLLERIVVRHPAELEIPLIWQKLDPALGAALVFLPPCFVLALLPPCLIRFATRDLTRVGRVSGWVYGAGSAGSIGGVFVSGYFLIDVMSLTQVFRWTGATLLGLAGVLARAGRGASGEGRGES